MISSLTKRLEGVFTFALVSLAMAAPVGMPQVAAAEAPKGPLLYDTLTPIGGEFKPEEKTQWRAVPDDLLLLEKEPQKASSDPGYYGREYTFQGDAVVETPTLAAVFWSAKGCVTFYSKPGGGGEAKSEEHAGWRKIADLVPLAAGAGSFTISSQQVVRNADDEIVLRVAFAQPGSRPGVGVFSFDKTGIVAVKPVENFGQVRLSGLLRYGVVPGFIGDDLIFGGPESPGTNPVAVPCENLFLGLLDGESAELVMTWPEGKQRMSLRFGDEQAGKVIQAIDFDNGGQSFYLGVLSAPGIWHKEALSADYLEKDVRSQWKRPFDAKWKTQLLEEELKTTFAFRRTKGQIWRGVAGSYQYPVWFSGEDTFFHLGKKVEPKGESIVYCLEGRDTPGTVLTPADILKQTLGRQAAADILDTEGRKLRTHHRRAGEGVRRACTCGCTEAIQAVFEAGEEVGQKDYIQGALDDMIYFVRCHVERIGEYQRFADGVLKKIREKRNGAPGLKPFLDRMEEIAGQIPQECEVQKENMKTLGHADELSRKTIALASKKDPGNLKAYMELLKAWRDMGGAQDYVVAKCHTITRSLFQAAGYGCAALPEALPLAGDIRADCRRALRNPDGYEVWADY